MKRAILCGILIISWHSIAARAGNLQPPGPPGPTMKPLDQVEPRTPVQSLSSSATAQYRIATPGSYYLIGNVDGSSGTNGIEIVADGVTLDLAGFSVNAPEVRSGSEVGIDISSKGVSLRNGTIRGWAGGGVIAGSAKAASYTDLQFLDNGLVGLSAGVGANVVRCVANGNGSGIITDAGSLVTECSVSDNVNEGIHAGFGSLIKNSTASGTLAGPGFFTLSSTVLNCAALQNETGIFVNGTSLVSGCTLIGNTGDGILANDRCRVVGNLCHNNATNAGTAGIRCMSVGNTIDGNQLTGNTIGLKTANSPNAIIRNVASGNVTNYSLAAGINTVGPMLSAGAIASTNPWANFDL